MGEFEAELMRRSPLAACVLEMCDHVFDDAMLAGVWDAHRGRCYEDVLKFPDLLRLMRDALVNRGGSAHQTFTALLRRGPAPVDESNFYRKLARTPVAVSRALLRDGAARLAALAPAGGGGGRGGGVSLPACFDAYAVLVGDGKKVRDAAKRLKPTRGFAGRLIGAKALVALDLRTGLAVAMSDSLDGMANDVPLVPALMAQLRAGPYAARPLLTVWDRQFDDPRTLGRLGERAGDAYVVRMKQLHACFAVESAVESADARGRRVVDEVGVLGKGKAAVRVRRVTLCRAAAAAAAADEEDVVLLTNLLDRAAYPAADLLALYKERWGIERVFQQVTETFALGHLIGSSPKAVLFQFAFCLLLYDLIQVVKAHVAADGGVRAAAVSTFYLFDDVRRELPAWAYHTDGAWPRASPARDAAAMRARLAELLAGSWDPVAYPKRADAKPRPKPPPKKPLHGGHTSVQRLLEGKVKLAVK